VPTEAKLAYINALAASGEMEIEATSFVHPAAIPQLADADALFRRLPRESPVRYSALVPNQYGMTRAMEAGARSVAVFTAASESFTRRNINMTIDESLRAFEPVLATAQMHGIPVRGYISTAFVCPYDGAISTGAVKSLATRLLAMGVSELSIGDTIGVATPRDVVALLRVLFDEIPPDRLSVHFHDTRGCALANVLAALQMGVTTVDAAAGGLGGCPFAPGAAGNLATEDLVYMLDGMGIETGISLDGVCRATQLMARSVGITPTSKMYKAWEST
jgi:isopropylmalate/homocitrate/citramalate synthase